MLSQLASQYRNSTEAEPFEELAAELNNLEKEGLLPHHKRAPVERRSSFLPNKKIVPTNYARLIVGILTVLSTILTGMLYACYQHPNKLKSNLHDFAIAMICITALFCLLSIVTLIYLKGVGDDPKGYKKIIIGICLVVELCDIAASVYIYMKDR